MSKLVDLNTLVALPKISRREFIQTAVAAGTAATVAMSAWNKAQAATPRRGGKLRLGSSGGSTTNSLDGAALIDSHPVQTSWMIRNNLTEITADGIAPELAESWEASRDAKVWIFRLRQGVEFHNGKTLDAEDVIHSINYHRGPDTKSGGKGAVSGIEDVKADGSTTVVFTLQSGNSDFPFLMADYHLPIVPAGTTGGDFNTGIGTGPYVLTAWEPGVRSAGKRNPNYFKEGRAWFDEVENLNITDTTARQNALQTNEVDAIESPSLKTLTLLAKLDGVTIHELGGTKHYTMPMRMDVDPFGSNDVRLALKYAIDREAMLAAILLGHGYLGNDHPIGKNQPFFASGLEQRTYDPDKAKFHLKQAGLSTVSVALSAGEIYEGAVDSAVLFKEHAAKAGIDIEIVRESSDGYWSDVWNKKPFTLCFWDGRVTADWMFSTAYESTASWNDTVWKNEQFDKTLAAARVELDEAKRAQMYYELQQLVRDDGGVIVPMFANQIFATRDTIVTSPKIAADRNLDGFRGAERWWSA